MKHYDELQAMTVKELRQYAIDHGYGIRYLSELKKKDIILIILEEDSKSIERWRAELKKIPPGGWSDVSGVRVSRVEDPDEDCCFHAMGTLHMTIEEVLEKMGER